MRRGSVRVNPPQDHKGRDVASYRHACQTDAVNLDDLEQLPTVDQHVFLRGRIVTETVAIEAEVRNLRVSLLRATSEEAFFAEEQSFSRMVEKCRAALTSRPDLGEQLHAVIGEALSEAKRLYDLRSRYLHDLLTANRDATGYHLLRMDKKPRKVDPTPTSTEDMIALIEQMSTAWWKLYAAVAVVHTRDAEWEELLFGSMEGDWYGTLTFIGPA